MDSEESASTKNQENQDEIETIIVPEQIKQQIRYNSINCLAGVLYESYIYLSDSVRMLMTIYDKHTKTYPVIEFLKKILGKDYETTISQFKQECSETMYKINCLIGTLKSKTLTDAERKQEYRKILNSIYNEDDLKDNCEITHYLYYTIISHTDLINLSIPKYEIDIARQGDLTRIQDSNTYLEE
jgi:hypothetical protein